MPSGKWMRHDMTSDKTHFTILQPSGWAKPKGYANGIAATGKQIFIAGQIGWNGDCVFQTDDFVAQVEQALRNIVAVLAEANAGPEHMTRMTWYILDKREYVTRSREVGDAYRRVIGKNFPAMTLVVVAALLEDRAKVEIEVTAVA
jgi:enamine deaminase RidA (YjgF/YER057c/UK114 family)